MDFSVDLSDWSALYPTARAVKTTAAAPVQKQEEPLKTVTFEDVLKQETTPAAPNAPAPSAQQSVPTAQTQQTAKFVTSSPIVLPTSKDFRPQQPMNILPSAQKTTAADTVQTNDLAPIIASANAAPGDRLNTEMNRTHFYADKNPYRTDVLKQSKQPSPYNVTEETRQDRRTSRPLQGVDGMTAQPMSSVRRYNRSSTKPAFNKAPANNSISDARDDVKKQTARAESRQNDETYRAAVRDRQINSGELVSMMQGDKIGYDRATTPSMTNAKNSAAAAWIPEATTRALDSYEAARKLAN